MSAPVEDRRRTVAAFAKEMHMSRPTSQHTRRIIGLLAACAIASGGSAGCGNNGAGSGTMGTSPETDMSMDAEMPPPEEDMPVEEVDMDEEEEDMEVEEDTTAPMVSITSSMLASPDGAYTLTGTAMDDTEVTELAYVIGDEDPVAIDPITSPFSAALTLEQGATITVTARDAAGNEATDAVDVELEEPPPTVTASFTVSSMPLVNEPVVFDASSTMGPDNDPLTYEWTLGDGSDPRSGVQVGNLYRTAQTYMVTLTVTADSGLSDTATKMVTVSDPMPMGQATVEGVVLDTTAKVPISGVEVRDASGQLLAETDFDGTYSFVTDRNVGQVLHFERAGWLKQVERIKIPADVSTWSLDTHMLRPAFRGYLTGAENGGIVADNTGRIGQTGASVTFEPDSFIDDQGNPVTGTIAVSITPVMPRDETFEAFPGGFGAMRPTGDTSSLGTYGTMDITLTQGDREVYLDKDATIRIPIETDVAPGDTIDLWNLDEQAGIWVQEDPSFGTVVVENGNTFLEASVSHFSWWNADVFLSQHTATLRVEVERANGTKVPLADALPPDERDYQIDAETVDGPGRPRTRVDGTIPVDRVDPPVALPTNSETEVTITAGNGRYVGSQVFDVDGTEGEYVVVVQDRGSDTTPGTTKIAYGETKTHTFTQASEQHFYTIDVAAGDLFEVKVSATDNKAEGRIYGVSKYGSKYQPKTFTRFNDGIWRWLARQAGTITVVVEAAEDINDVGAIEVTLTQLTKDDAITPDTEIDLNGISANGSQYAMWLHAGTFLNVLRYGDVPRGTLELVGTQNSQFGRTRAAQSGNSKVFEVDQAGLYLLEYSQGFGSGFTGEHTIAITEMEYRDAIGPDAATTTRIDIPIPGKTTFLRKPLPPGHIATAQARGSIDFGATAPDPTNITYDGRVGMRMGVVDNTGWDNEDEGREFPATEVMDAMGNTSFAREQLSLAREQNINGNTQVVREATAFYGLFECENVHKDALPVNKRARIRECMTGSIDIAFETSPPKPSTTVGTCMGADTRLLTTALDAVDANGEITLCDGTHEVFSRMSTRNDRLKLVGAGSDRTTLRFLPGGGIGRNNDAFRHLEGITAQVHEPRSGVLSLVYDRQTSTPVVARDIIIDGTFDDGPTNAMAFALGSDGPDPTTPDLVTAEDIEILGAFDLGIYASDLLGVTLSDVTITGAATGFDFSDLEDITIDRATLTSIQDTGILSRSRTTGMTVDNTTIELDLSTAGFRLRGIVAEPPSSSFYNGPVTTTTFRNTTITLVNPPTMGNLPGERVGLLFDGQEVMTTMAGDDLLEVDNVTITGPFEEGILLRDTDGLLIESVTIDGATTGINLSSLITNARIQNTLLDNIEFKGITTRFSDLRDLLILNSTINLNGDISTEQFGVDVTVYPKPRHHRGIPHH